MKEKKSIEQLKKEGLVKPASEQSVFDIEKLNKKLKELEWVSVVEDYCNSQNITPSDLIVFHKENNGKKSVKKANKEEIKPERQSMSNWRKDFREKKTGIKS